MRIVGLIQARMGSTRLPGKVIKEINGLPLIVHIYRRLLACKELDGVSISWGCAECFGDRCGSCIKEQPGPLKTCKSCGKFFEVAQRYFLKVIGGPEYDLISRHSKVSLSALLGADAFVRITADCLFHDPSRIDAMVRDYRLNYPKYRGLSNRIPRTVSEGLDAEIYSTELLSELDRNLKCPREDFAVYAEENRLLGCWPFLEQQRYPIGQDLHLSIDTQQDFDRAEKMLKWLGSNDIWSYDKTLKAYHATQDKSV